MSTGRNSNRGTLAERAAESGEGDRAWYTGAMIGVLGGK